jgi:hypothetical protein
MISPYFSFKESISVSAASVVSMRVKVFSIKKKGKTLSLAFGFS